VSTHSHTRLAVHRIGDHTLVRFLDRHLGEPNITALRQELLPLAARGRLRLDFAQVESLSGAVLGLLVALHLDVRAFQGELSLHNVAPDVHEIFAVTGLTAVLTIRQKKGLSVTKEPRIRRFPVISLSVPVREVGS